MRFKQTQHGFAAQFAVFVRANNDPRNGQAVNIRLHSRCL